jgi:hypothetical protein
VTLLITEPLIVLVVWSAVDWGSAYNRSAKVMQRIDVTAIEATKRRQLNECGAMVGEDGNAELRH